MIKKRKLISVIIPFNELKFVKNINILCDFELVREVIVLNNSGRDIRRFFSDERFSIIDIDNFDHGRVRNEGAKQSKGDILLFMTQDAIPLGEDFDIKISESFSYDIKGVYGKHVVLIGSSPFEKFEREMFYGDEKIIKPVVRNEKLGFQDVFVSNVCFAVDRNVFFEVGGFPENIISSEELILSYKIIKAGYRIMYNPDIQVEHSHHSDGVLKDFKRWFDLGVFFSEYPEIYSGFIKIPIYIFTREFLFFLLNSPSLIPKLLFRGFVRALAIQLGMNYRVIPWYLRYKLSLNKNFWLNNSR